MLKFDGKIVFLTGGNSGIGKITADLFVSRGTTVVSTDIDFSASDSQEINFETNPILFLASHEASYITGEVLDVNGGMLMD